MLAALPAAASAQTILNEGFETTSTDQYSPNFPDGWSTVDSYTGNNNRCAKRRQISSNLL